MSELTIYSTNSKMQANQKRTAKGAIAVIRNSALALAAGAALALGSFGFVTPADAAPSKDNNATLCGDLRNIYVTNIGIANDPKSSAEDVRAAKEAAADAKADFNKYCGGKSSRAGGLTPSFDLGALPQDMAPETDGGTNTSPVDTSVSIGTRLSAR